MVNSGSYDSDADRNAKGEAQSASSVLASCEEDFATQTADGLLPPHAIEPTASKTDYTCNMSELLLRARKILQEAPVLEGSSTGKTDVLETRIDAPKDEKKIKVCCSVPLEKVQDILKVCRTPPKKQISKKELCLYCDRTFATSSLKQKHVERFHSVKYNRRLSTRRQVKPSVTACMFCEQLNNTECTLKQLFNHLVTSHSKKYFGCLDCETRFPTSQSLKNHVLKVHADTKELIQNLIAEKRNRIQLNTVEPLISTDSDQKINQASSPGCNNQPTMCSDAKPTKSITCSKPNTESIQKSTAIQKSILNQKSNTCSVQKSQKSIMPTSKPAPPEPEPVENKDNNAVNSTENPILEGKEPARQTLKTKTKTKKKKVEKETKTNVEEETKTNIVVNSESVKTADKVSQKEPKHKGWIKELRSKKVAVISTKMGIKQGIRITRQQTKLLETNKNKKKVKAPKSEKNDKTSVSTKYLSYQNHHPYTFDFSFRIKKITDHSIDNIKISSLTFDDVFDKAFFNRVKCNIQENLQNHIDGKLFKSVESENRISSFQKSNGLDETNQNIGCKISTNAVTPVAASLLGDNFGEDIESQIEYGSKAKKKASVVNDEVHYKYFTRRKYQAVISENKQHRDLSKLDMWTQLVVKTRQQKILSDQKTDKEKLEYKKSDEYKVKMQVEELDRILDKRGPLEDLKEEAIRTVALEKLNGSSDSAMTNIESYFDVTMILNELLNNLFTSGTPASLSAPIAARGSSSTSVSTDGAEIPAMLNLQRVSHSDTFVQNSELENSVFLELTGEWARTRIYVCAACGLKMPNAKSLMDHKNLYHEQVWCQHYEFVGNQGELYRHLSIPGIGKVGEIENSGSKILKRSDARACSKCNKQFNCLGDLHRHVLECGGDWTWMLARKKYKYRSYGSKARKRRRGLLKFLHAFRERKQQSREKAKTIKKFEGPRPKPSDADSIQRMLANLPPKRTTRKIICLKDGLQRNVKNKNVPNTNKKLSHKKMQVKKTSQKNANVQNVKSKRSLRMLRSNSGHIFENKLVLPKLKKENKDAHVVRRHSVRNISRAVSNSLVKSTSKAKTNDTQNKEKEAVKDKSISNNISKLDRTSRRMHKEILSTDTKSEIEEVESLKIPKKTTKTEEKKIEETPLTTISSKKSKKARVVNDITEPTVITEEKPKINPKKIPPIRKKRNKQKLVTDQTTNIIVKSNKKALRLPNGRFMKKGNFRHIDPGMPHLEPEVLIDNIEDDSQYLKSKIPQVLLTPETIPNEPPLLDPLPKIPKIKKLKKKPNIPTNPDTALYVPKTSDRNSKLTLRLKKTKPCIKINLRTSCRKNTKSKEAIKNRKSIKNKIKKSIIKLIQVDGSSQNKPSTRSAVKNDFLGIETMEGCTEEISLEKGKVNDEREEEKMSKQENLPIQNVDTSDINDSILESNNEAPNELIIQSEIPKSNTDVSLVTVKTEVVESEEMKNEEKVAQTAPPITIPKLSPAKKKKKQRGLNDCIAMLTNKLQDKNFTQQPFQSSIFGSVIDKPPNGFPLVQFNVFSKREEISETKFQTNSKPLGGVCTFDLNGDKMKNKENVELSTKPTYSSILAKPRFISNFYESTTTPCFWKENKIANASILLHHVDNNDKEKEELTASTPVINTEEADTVLKGDGECSIKSSECEVEVPLIQSESNIQNITENCNEDRDGPNESILKVIEEETLKLSTHAVQEKENIDGKEDHSPLINTYDTSLSQEIIESPMENEDVIDQPEDLSKSRNILSSVKSQSKANFPILKISVSKATLHKKKKQKTKKTSTKNQLKKNLADVLVLINDVKSELTGVEQQFYKNDEVVGDNHQIVDMELIEDCIHAEINENVILEKDSQNVKVKEIEETSNRNENLIVPAEDFTNNTEEKQDKSVEEEFIDSEDDLPLVKLIDKSRSESNNDDEETCTEAQNINESNSYEHVTDDVLNKTGLNLDFNVMGPDINGKENVAEKEIEELTSQGQDDLVKQALSNNIEKIKVPIKIKKRGKKKNEKKANNTAITNHEEKDLPQLQYENKETLIKESIDNQDGSSINNSVNLTANEIQHSGEGLAKEVPVGYLKNGLVKDIVENENVSKSEEPIRPINEVQRQNSFSSENDLQLDTIALDLEQAEKVLDHVLNNVEKSTQNEDLFDDLNAGKPDEIPKESEVNEPEEPEHNDTSIPKNKRVKHPPKSKKIVPKKIFKNATSPEDIFCEICNKVFSRSENLLKHRRTLTHIAKLSELEAAQAAEKAKQIEEIQKPVEQEKNEDLLNNEVTISYEYPKSDISSFSFASRQGSLKLVDIISDVLSKPINNDFPKSNFADLILPSDHEIKRCKSLGERKSFESDKLFFGASSPASNIDLDQKFSKLSNTANVIVEKQLSILENMIEDNRMNFSGSERMFDSSELPPSEEYSNQSSSSAFSLLSSNKPEECNEITFRHNTNIISNLIKPALDEENVIQTTQYEEISDDSSSSHFQAEEQTSRKVLNRDEELFLECCSLLKSSSDVSDLCKKPKSAQFLNNFGLKPLDESSEWLEHKQLAPQKTSNLDYVSNSFISDDSHMNTSVGDNFYDYSNSNSNINLKGILERTKNDHMFSQPPIFEDISNGSEDSSCKSELKLNSVPKVNKETEFDKLKIDSQLSPNVESAQIPKVQEVEEPIDIEENGEKIAPGSKILKLTEDSQEGKLSKTQASVMDNTISKKAKKNDNKKMLTKGAMKVFEGLKVSIPKNGLDMKEVLSCSPTSKRLQLEAEEEKEKKVEKDPIKHNFRYHKIINTEGIKKIGNKLGLKITKRKFGTSLKNNKEKEEEEKKGHDVYDFEETQDNMDTFAVNSNSLTNYRTFRNKFAEKSDVSFSKDEENIDECKKDDKDIKDNKIIEEEKVIDKEKEKSISEDSVMTPLKKLDTCKSITKKKCMIMGRIFKNAVKPKLTDDIKSLPVMENSKLVESFVLDCQKHHSNLENNKKLSEEEMNIIFDNLLNEEKSSKRKEKPEVTDINLVKKDRIDNQVVNKSVKSTDHRKKSKTKKRQRTNSTDSSDEEFSMKKIPKRHYKKTKNTEHVINLEQELKECIGVASRKSQRKCTSGKQNVLVEYWSSDESSSDIEQFETNEIPPELPLPSPEPPTVVEPAPRPPLNVEEVQQEETTAEEKEIKKTSKPKQLRKKQPSEVDEESKQSIASTRKKRSAVDTLYYWSSSSEDELHDVIEVKPLREEFDDEDRPLQHGWIVGDSPKKLVTMLAQAKGKKLESECVKKNKKKRTSV